MVSTGITRRGFTVTAFANAAMAAEAAPAHVIDVATHFYDTSRPQGVPWPTANQPVLYKPTFPARYLDAIKPYRVDGVVAIEASPWLEDNLWLLTLADREPLIRAVVGNIAPGHSDFHAALDRFSKHPLFRGIRIGAGAVEGILSDDRRFADVAYLAERGQSLDVLVSAAPQYARIASLAGRLPMLRIIVGHLPLDDLAGLQDLGAHARVYAKVSGVVRRVNGEVPKTAAYYKTGLDELWRVFGPERVVYASNWPASDLTAPYPIVYSVMSDYLGGRPEGEVDRFFWKNAMDIYRITLPAGRG